ncbi:MAG: hypothetical protein IKP91_09885 [Bacteroidaceae bacterium]|nr:hypothetical protein [Bacteroidaceae bacterium]
MIIRKNTPNSRHITVLEKPFRDAHIGNATLHVLADLVEENKQVVPWNEFRNIVVLTEEEITGIRKAPSDKPIIRYFDLSGKELDAPDDGITIVVNEHEGGQVEIRVKGCAHKVKL